MMQRLKHDISISQTRGQLWPLQDDRWLLVLIDGAAACIVLQQMQFSIQMLTWVLLTALRAHVFCDQEHTVPETIQFEE